VSFEILDALMISTARVLILIKTTQRMVDRREAGEVSPDGLRESSRPAIREKI